MDVLLGRVAGRSGKVQSLDNRTMADAEQPRPEPSTEFTFGEGFSEETNRSFLAWCVEHNHSGLLKRCLDRPAEQLAKCMGSSGWYEGTLNHVFVHALGEESWPSKETLETLAEKAQRPTRDSDRSVLEKSNPFTEINALLLCGNEPKRVDEALAYYFGRFGITARSFKPTRPLPADQDDQLADYDGTHESLIELLVQAHKPWAKSILEAAGVTREDLGEEFAECHTIEEVGMWIDLIVFGALERMGYSLSSGSPPSPELAMWAVHKEAGPSPAAAVLLEMFPVPDQ